MTIQTCARFYSLAIGILLACVAISGSLGVVAARPSLRWRSPLNVSSVFNAAKFGASKQSKSSGFIGLPYREVYAKLTGRAVPGSKGDKQAHGWLDINVYKWNNEYNVRFFTSTLGLSRNEVPTSVTLHRGNPKRDGTSDTNLVLSFDSLQAASGEHTGGSSAASTLTFPWLAVDPTPLQRLRGYNGHGFMQEGTVWKARGVQVDSTGKSLRRLLDELIKRPGKFYGVVKTPSFPDGAVLGRLQGSLVTKLLH
ncbi:hypothetical protein CLOM_g24167 [Closterium sp. NIES-68]|nr:hypothetical protein CLOM_g24361 [Closterium sp. NIES-68]GJP39827.1 hypothetical protein CLOM_g24167 [Closterium sp. NIES-68]GJP86591.1 hypothetical protein CLOP_g16595 [Closterium sp. NIES-67]